MYYFLSVFIIKLKMEHFVIASVDHLTTIPLKIRFYYKNVQLFFRLTTLMGLINHSLYIRGRVFSALKQKLQILDFQFTEEHLDHHTWLLWLGGSKTSRPNFKNIDLKKFLAFSHCYMFQESFIESIINFELISTKNPSLFKAIYYSKKMLGWNSIVNGFWVITLRFRLLDIPHSKFKRYIYFKKFVRNAIRSANRFSKAKKFHNPILGASVCLNEKCVMCQILPDASWSSGQPNWSLEILDPLSTLWLPSYKHHTVRCPCPSTICTPSWIIAD